MSNHELPQEAIKLMVDLSTAHIMQNDTVLCQQRADTFSLTGPRMLVHDYGYIVFVNSDPEARESTLGWLRGFGFSEAFVDIYDRAASSQGDIILINFDQDGATIEGLPTFEW